MSLGPVGVILAGGGAPAGDVPLDQGAGPNLPGGFSRWFEFDVTQANQRDLNTALGSQGWDPEYNDDMTGSVEWGVTKLGYQTARLYWPEGQANEGRKQGMELRTSDEIRYSELYVRSGLIFSPQNDPPASDIKIFDFDHGNVVLSAAQWDPPLEWRIYNITLQDLTSQYTSQSQALAPADVDTFVEVEAHFVWNSDISLYDGSARVWLNGTEITSWDEGDPSTDGFKMQSSGSDVGFRLWKWGPYRGGQGGAATITDEPSIWVTGLSIWVPTAELP